MRRLYLLILTFLLADIASADLKVCNFVMGHNGILTITRESETDLRGLPPRAIAEVLRSLKDHWVELQYRESLPSFERVGQTQSLLMRIEGTEGRGQLGRRRYFLIGTSGQFNGRDGGRDGGALLRREVGFDEIVSVKIVDFPRDEQGQLLRPIPPTVRVSLLEIVKIDGRPKLSLSNRLDEQLNALAEGSAEAAKVLGTLLAYFMEEPTDLSLTVFGSFMKALEERNIRGPQIVAAFKVYAHGDPGRLSEGIFNEPIEVVEAVNSALPHYTRAATFPSWKSDKDKKLTPP